MSLVGSKRRRFGTCNQQHSDEERFYLSPVSSQIRDVNTCSLQVGSPLWATLL